LRVRSEVYSREADATLEIPLAPETPVGGGPMTQPPAFFALVVLLFDTLLGAPVGVLADTLPASRPGLAGSAETTDQPALGETPTSAKPAEKAAAPAPETGAALPPDTRAVTRHALALDGGELPYRATAAALTLKDDLGRPRSRIFYIAYEREARSAPAGPSGRADATRPLTFVFNGGPGAASAYLHLGALGPKRIAFEADGAVPPPPVRLMDNAETWLPFTDLVFVDPPDTGYSRMLGDNRTAAANTGKGTEEGEAAGAKGSPFGIEEDAEILADFIRRYLTAEGRWGSPVFLAGESYGGFRVALLGERLHAEVGVAPSGLVLISPVLDFALIRGGEQVLLRWCALLPSYAAVAAYHGLGAPLELDDADPRAGLRAVEDYALQGLLTGLAAAGSDAADRQDLYQRLAGYTGLTVAELRRHRARVPASRFAKALLADQRRLVSLYDGALTAIDPDPTAPWVYEDLFLERLGSALTAGFQVHVRDNLRLETDLPYRLLNDRVSKAWNWDSGVAGDQGFADVTGDLRRSLSLNPAMGILVVHGVHDLVTPYFASAVSLRQLGLDPALNANLRLAVYAGGHMFYGRQTSRERLRLDAMTFYRDTLGRGAAPQTP